MKVYLAGPSIFRADANAHGELLKRLCRAAGLEGMYPLDGDLRQSQLIFNANCRLIHDASAVVADISPFRGPHMDCGTAWELGYAYSLGLPIFAYTSSVGVGRPTMLPERIWGLRDPEKSLRDKNGLLIEEFGLAENLMIVHSIQSVATSPEEAIEACRVFLLKENATGTDSGE